MLPYKLHIFVCLGKRCADRGSEEVLDTFKEWVRASGLKDTVRVSKSGCIKVCKETSTDGEFAPAVVIYPEGVWYRNVTTDDVDEIMERHVKKGEVVERLLHFKL